MPLLALPLVLAVGACSRSGPESTPSGGSAPRSTAEGPSPSGDSGDDVRSVGVFHGVTLDAAAQVTVRRGERASVVVRAEPEVARRVTTKVIDGVLVIGSDEPYSARTPVRVAVVTAAVDSLALNGSGTIDVAGFQSARLSISLAGSGSLRGSGRAEELEVNLAGSGRIQLFDLTAATVSARLPGSGHIEVTATQSLDAAIAGAGDVVYGGRPPVVRDRVAGAGRVSPR